MEEHELGLMARLQTGDENALAELYELLGGKVYTLAIKMLNSPEEAEEVVQDSFLKLYNNAQSYRPKRASVRTFLYAIARNDCLSRLRKRQARPVKALGYDINDPASSFAGQTTNRVERLFVERLLDEVSHEERQLLEAAFFLGHSHSELAEIYDMPLGTVKTKIRRALHKLRDIAEDL